MLGVDVYPGTAKAGSGSYGLTVANVVPGSGAEAAGIEEGDVILEIDGKRMASGTDLFCHIQSRGPGARVALRLMGRKAGEGERRLSAIVGTWPPGAPPPIADCMALH